MFTVNLRYRLRYDFRTAPFESNDRMGWRDLSNPRGGLLVSDQKLVDSGIVGDSSYYKFAGRRNPADSPKKVFAPRIGFAFRPFSDDKTVVRGGYGIFWDSASLVRSAPARFCGPARWPRALRFVGLPLR